MKVLKQFRAEIGAMVGVRMMPEICHQFDTATDEKVAAALAGPEQSMT